MRPNDQLSSWSLVNALTFSLFFVCAFSAVAAVRVLCDSGTTGLLRVTMQSVCIILPLAVIAHATWRGFSLPIPKSIALSGWAILLLFASAAPWPRVVSLAYPKPRAELTLNDLSFPAILIHDSTSVQTIDSPADLQKMHSNRVWNRRNDPVLIDSHFTICTLADLQLKQNALLHMASGLGVGDVSFRLVRNANDGTAAVARSLLFSCTYLSADADRSSQIRTQIESEETLEGMIRAIRGE